MVIAGRGLDVGCAVTGGRGCDIIVPVSATAARYRAATGVSMDGTVGFSAHG
ncbi:MAG: hypothetical protein O2968_04300 [Acidobacteria bacterium]|nr:hypothetical protein [Acidobacteriota bacterium]